MKITNSTLRLSAIFLFGLCWQLSLGASVFGPAKVAGKDSSLSKDSVSITEDFLKLRIALKLAVGFSEFGSQKYYSDDLNYILAQRYSRDSALALETPEDSLQAVKGRILQGYNPVMVYFPLGIELAYAPLASLQFFGQLNRFWKEQSAIIEVSDIHPKGGEASSKSLETNYGVSALNVYGGLRVKIPMAWIYLNPNQALFLSYSRIWTLPQSEIYSNGHSAKAKASPFGVGQEFSLGMNLGKFKFISIYSEMALCQLEYKAKGNWGMLLKNTNEDPIKWSFQAIKFNFLFNFPLW